MSKLNSRSFWLTALIVVCSAWFTHAGTMGGGQWVALSTVVLGLWQAKDALGKLNGN